MRTYGNLLSDADDDGRITRVPYDPAYPVHTAWDLGINDQQQFGLRRYLGVEL